MDHDSVAQFAGITGSSDHIAAQYLRLAEGNTAQAIELFFANDGADLEASSRADQPPMTSTTVPPPATRPTQQRQNYQDSNGVVHLDSDQEDEDADEDDDIEFVGRGRRQIPAVEKSNSSVRDSETISPSTGLPGTTADNDESMARRLQEEYYGAAGGGNGNNGTGSEVLDEYGYRAPLGRTTETLVGPGSFDPANAEEMRAAVMEQMARRQNPRHRGKFNHCLERICILTSKERHGIFNQATTSSIWNEAEAQPDTHRARLSQATGGASEASSKSNLLAEMYRPPFELLSRLPWDQARQQGKEGQKWILVNIQDPSIFDCQVLNRDLWKNPGIMETVKENFIFMQYSKDDPKGNQYIQYYFPDKDNQDAYPHIAIVDPRTGEKVKVWSGPPVPKAMDFLMQLHEFLDRYSLNATAKNPVAKRKPEPKPATQVDRMTEEQMMEMAVKASLAGAEQGKQIYDPDDLTRSVGEMAEEKGRQGGPKENLDGDDGSEKPATTNGSTNTTISSFNSISSSNPHVEPPSDAPNSTRIQFRHPNGRVVRRFALTDSVRRMFEWLKASPLEGKEGLEFELIFMGKNLVEALDDTIEQAGLKNGTVMVELIES